MKRLILKLMDTLGKEVGEPLIEFGSVLEKSVSNFLIEFKKLLKGSD